MKLARIPLCLVVSLLAGCGTAPLSFVMDRQVYHPAVAYRYPVTVIAIDGTSSFTSPVQLAPGLHQLTVDAPPVAGFHDPDQQYVSLQVAPCTRYYVAAQRKNRLTQDWQFVVEEVEPVGGCSPAAEMTKTSRIDSPAMAPEHAGSPG